MNKNQSNPAENIWDAPENTGRPVKPEPKTPRATPQPEVNERDFDIEGLMTDFPTAKELERFVYDETGVVLNLKGRANKLKYQVAMDVLNGAQVDPKFIGGDNPYLEKADLVPEEPLKVLPPKSSEIPDASEIQNEFFTAFVPHSDPEYHAQGRKMHCTFRKYKNGMITYEVVGPIEPRPYGLKIDKFGRERPEIIKWVDPRTGEQIIQREDGTYTPIGRRLKAMMQSMKYNRTNQWLRYIDREFVSLDHKAALNPWDLS